VGVDGHPRGKLALGQTDPPSQLQDETSEVLACAIVCR